MSGILGHPAIPDDIKPALIKAARAADATIGFLSAFTMITGLGLEQVVDAVGNEEKEMNLLVHIDQHIKRQHVDPLAEMLAEEVRNRVPR